MSGRRGEKSEPREKARKRRERGREREKLTAAPDSSIAFMAGNVVVVEADSWDPSDVTEEMLQSLVDGGLLRPVTDPSRPEWIAPYGEPELRPRDGYVMSFVSFHKRGLGVPMD